MALIRATFNWIKNSPKTWSNFFRYAQNFPHAEVLFCSIILEFGKKRDLGSALEAFEASKQILSSPNMHAYRTIIDVCGLCGDYLKSRAIYEVLMLVLSEPLWFKGVFYSLLVILKQCSNYVNMNCQCHIIRKSLMHNLCLDWYWLIIVPPGVLCCYNL